MFLHGGIKSSISPKYVVDLSFVYMKGLDIIYQLIVFTKEQHPRHRRFRAAIANMTSLVHKELWLLATTTINVCGLKLVLSLVMQKNTDARPSTHLSIIYHSLS